MKMKYATIMCSYREIEVKTKLIITIAIHSVNTY